MRFLLFFLVSAVAYDVFESEEHEDENEEEKTTKEKKVFTIRYEWGPNGEMIFGDAQSDEFKNFVKNVENDDRMKELQRFYEKKLDDKEKDTDVWELLEQMQQARAMMQQREVEIEQEMFKNGTMTPRKVKEETEGDGEPEEDNEMDAEEEMENLYQKLADRLREEL